MDEDLRQSAVMPSTCLKCLAVGSIIVIAPALFTGNSIRADRQLRDSLAHHGLRVPGVVTGFGGGSRNAASFRFNTADDRLFDTSYSGALSYPEHDHLGMGAKVDVVYDPDDPDRAIPEPFATVPPCDLGTQLSLMRKLMARMLAAGLAIALLCAMRLSQQQEARQDILR